MGNIVLLCCIILFQIIALIIFKDIFAPACLVCESFLLAYICACYSSYKMHWNFQLSSMTVTLICIGIFCFLLGSIWGFATNSNRSKILPISELQMLTSHPAHTKILLALQLIILLVYINYFLKSIEQFSGMSMYETLRMYRFIASYGDGLETPIPRIVEHMTKISRANAYISLYLLMHNLALKKVFKLKFPKETWIHITILLLYMPYSVLKSARFELLVLITMGLVIWYTFLKRYSVVINRNYHILTYAFVKMVAILLIAMVFFSILGSFVGRTKTDGILLEAANYFGRTMQAFDVFIKQDQFNAELINNESFYNIVKFLKQLHLLPATQPKFFLEFVKQNDFSLGNTFTALRRYYADFDISGVIILTTISGGILTFWYKKCIYPKVGDVDFVFLCYASISYCMFLYSYEEYFWSTIPSINYLLTFSLMFILKKYYMGQKLITIKIPNK